MWCFTSRSDSQYRSVTTETWDSLSGRCFSTRNGFQALLHRRDLILLELAVVIRSVFLGNLQRERHAHRDPSVRGGDSSVRRGCRLGQTLGEPGTENGEPIPRHPPYNRAVPPSYHWNLYALPWAVVGITLFALSGVIFVRQRASRVAVLFCAMIVLVGFWFAGFASMLSALDAGLASVWARLALAAVCLLPGAIYDFSMTALRLYHVRRIAVYTVSGISLLFAVLALRHGLIVGEMTLHPWGYYPAAGPLLLPFLIFFFGSLLVHIAEYVAEYRRTADAARRRRLVRLMVSFLVVYFGAIDFLPMFGAPRQPLGYVPVLAFMAVAWGSIRRHRFTSITAARAARQILETMADALFVIDAEGKIRVINGAVRTLFGFSEPELLGKSIDTLEAVTDERTIARTLHALARRGPIRDQARVFRDRSGHSIDVSVSISPVGDSEVQEGAVVIARDVRERKRDHDELHSFTLRLQQSNRELEDFAYVASHDLQEPLRKIQAFSDLLKKKYAESVPPQARDYLDRMQSAAKRMQILINDLLAFSRVTTKAQPFVRVDLGEVAHEVARDLEIRAHEVGGRIVIGELPTVDADPLQMRQLLQNLTANALKFHKPGVPPVVEVRGTVVESWCRIVVSDNGIGFEEKYAERIFTIFERLHGRAKYEGTGIGLAICRKIAQRHGGDIAARGIPDEGSTFIVTIPEHQASYERETAHA
jgi:PAS domain S-box-containing protein